MARGQNGHEGEGVGTEEVEHAISAIAHNLSGLWIAVDLQHRGERLRHHHPPRCPAGFKVIFQGQPAVKLQVKGKFVCGNTGCRRSWSSAMGLLLLTVQPGGGQFRFSITALEQQCQRCGRDVFTRMYSDEAARVADWLTGAYELRGVYEERQQRASRMRRPHDKQRCSACRAGLH